MTNSPTVALNPLEALQSAAYRPTTRGPMRPEDFVPTRYLLHVKPTICSRCKAMHTQQQVVLVREHPAGGPGSTITQPVEELRMELPIGLSVLKVAKIPVCSACWETCPQPGERRAASEEAWREAQRRDADQRTQALHRARAPVAEGTLPSIDDLPEL